MATLTANPSDDGWAGVQGLGDQTWTTLRSHAGSIKQAQADVTSEATALRQGSTSGKWDLYRRAMFVVDTSSIPDTNTVTAAVLRLFVNSITTTITGQSLTICNGGPAGTTIASSDFGGNVSNTTVWGDTVALSSITTSAYNSWNFNATGLANISLTGNTKFQLRWESDRTDTEPGFVSAGALCTLNWNFGNAASNKSELVVTHSTPTGTTVVSTFLLMGVG